MKYDNLKLKKLVKYKYFKNSLLIIYLQINTLWQFNYTKCKCITTDIYYLFFFYILNKDNVIGIVLIIKNYK